MSSWKLWLSMREPLARIIGVPILRFPKSYFPDSSRRPPLSNSINALYKVKEVKMTDFPKLQACRCKSCPK